MMVYFRKIDNGEVFAYDKDDPAQASLIVERENDSGFEKLATWPPPRSVEDERQSKATEINGLCHLKIINGFPSDALGEMHTYPSKDTDQLNLSGSVIASLYPGLPSDWVTPFWCADENNTWTMQSHTASQIQTVGNAFVAFKLQCMAHNDALQQQIRSAQTAEEVQAIQWTL